MFQHITIVLQQGLDVIVHILVQQVDLMHLLVFSNSIKEELWRLDIVQTRVVRICTGVVCLSPVCAPQVETREIPLGSRQKQLHATYQVNLRGQKQKHPATQTSSSDKQRESWLAEISSLDRLENQLQRIQGWIIRNQMLYYCGLYFHYRNWRFLKFI